MAENTYQCHQRDIEITSAILVCRNIPLRRLRGRGSHGCIRGCGIMAQHAGADLAVIPVKLQPAMEFAADAETVMPDEKPASDDALRPVDRRGLAEGKHQERKYNSTIGPSRRLRGSGYLVSLDLTGQVTGHMLPWSV